MMLQILTLFALAYPSLQLSLANNNNNNDNDNWHYKFAYTKNINSQFSIDCDDQNGGRPKRKRVSPLTGETTIVKSAPIQLEPSVKVPPTRQEPLPPPPPPVVSERSYEPEQRTYVPRKQTIFHHGL